MPGMAYAGMLKYYYTCYLILCDEAMLECQECPASPQPQAGKLAQLWQGRKILEEKISTHIFIEYLLYHSFRGVRTHVKSKKETNKQHSTRNLILLFL